MPRCRRMPVAAAVNPTRRPDRPRFTARTPLDRSVSGEHRHRASSCRRTLEARARRHLARQGDVRHRDAGVIGRHRRRGLAKRLKGSRVVHAPAGCLPRVWTTRHRSEFDSDHPVGQLEPGTLVPQTLTLAGGEALDAVLRPGRGDRSAVPEGQLSVGTEGAGEEPDEAEVRLPRDERVPDVPGGRAVSGDATSAGARSKRMVPPARSYRQVVRPRSGSAGGRVPHHTKGGPGSPTAPEAAPMATTTAGVPRPGTTVQHPAAVPSGVPEVPRMCSSEAV